MSESKDNQRRHEEPVRDSIHHVHHPYWKRAHLDWRVWIGLFFMFAAIIIYFLSDDLAWMPHAHPRHHPPDAVRTSGAR
jgi:hypothetical protein